MDFYDEMQGLTPRTAAGTQPLAPPLPHYRAYQEWVKSYSAERYGQQARPSRCRVPQVGITFAVYGDDAGTERLIPFDLIPRIIPAAEWDIFGKRA